MTRLVLALCLLSTPVLAMERGRVDCPDRSVILTDLERAGESQVMIGVKPEGIVVEIFAAPNGNWTEIWTWPRGQTCVIAFGRDIAISAGGGT